MHIAIDIHMQGSWRECATVSLTDPKDSSRRGPVIFRYDAEYALSHLNAGDYRATGVRTPVDLSVRRLDHWPPFLLDLLPQGAARRRRQRGREIPLSEWALLQRGAANPVGNLRVRETNDALIHPVKLDPHHPGFELPAMVAHGSEFIDYAENAGVSVEQATDLQGEAPKLWVLETDDGLWRPDDGGPWPRVRRRALLKYPTPEAGARAGDMLRHEAAYQRVAHRLGLHVLPAPPVFVNGALLIPRFDRTGHGKREIRFGVESLNSVAGVLDSDDAPLTHYEALLALRAFVSDFNRDLVEYVRRDVLNLAMGNRDNHGFNTAVLKDPAGTIRLAPLYDFGPSFLDARALPRAMHWEGERRGQLDWNVILSNLAARFAAAKLTLDLGDLARSLRDFARDVERLPDLMRECDVDDEIVDARRPQIEHVTRSLANVRVP